MEIGIAETDKEISECYEVLSQLRPQLKKDRFVALIHELMLSQGYKLIYLKNPEIKSVMGIRIGLWLHTGKYLEIEDLVTSSNKRSNGYGMQLLNWAKEYAKANNCNQVRLVSGVAREQAHKFYQNNGMSFEAKYFSINI
ncbi:GNAT family N-acetyltransferase [Rheinheimera sp. YQF-2]|jgi:GNAT superfamily N-acetyltransferase|uniref:GNAT family N-acetyltransferase n=1 Tax=Rheinheimera lutimaris TaxID=2740584 RepID=A0A7Y5AU28_9GAMM|nr:GNAT family N-acetyltransferase [Rheinheimera lutimaris]NRQ43970.1 GNAT family N-acetyltransferase [Rheinheimera lutimaris]